MDVLEIDNLWFRPLVFGLGMATMVFLQAMFPTFLHGCRELLSAVLDTVFPSRKIRRLERLVYELREDSKKVVEELQELHYQLSKNPYWEKRRAANTPAKNGLATQLD